MPPPPFATSRRAWLLGTLGGLAIGPGRTRGDDVRDRARAAGLGPFEESESPNYRAIGDARGRFREEALGVCEGVAADYRRHFAEKGFALDRPQGRMAVVVLMGPKSYAAFEGEALGDAIGGHFDLKENRLVMFDFRGPGANPKAPVPELDNTLVLVHEAVHQLTYNTGVLDRAADVPLCISEGLATYGETWGPRGRGAIGSVNRRRMQAREDARKRGDAWIPLPTLLADDGPFEGPGTQQMAYAESWLMVRKLMRDPARLPAFRAYLKALRENPGPARRPETAAAHLGDLVKLDREVRSGR